MPKAAKAQSTSKALRVVKSNPFTPVRRLFFKLDRLRPGNGLRILRHGNPEPDPVVDTPPEQPVEPRSYHVLLQHKQASHTPACMALQNDDVAEDAVVITALTALPFCCHEDLLTMSRTALVGVCQALNAHLPAVLRITLHHTRTDAAIRHEIEFVVGLRTKMEVPQAPRAERARLGDRGHVPEVDVNEEMNRTPPTSPLAQRGRRMVQIYGTPGTPMLERLTEEDEEDEDRPAKRQRTQSAVKVSEASMDIEMGAAPIRPAPCALRGYSYYEPSSPTPTPRPRVLRSQSTQLPTKMASVTVDTTFINTTRPKHHKRADVEIGGQGHTSLHTRKTSTPKQKVRVASTRRPCLAPPQESASMSSLMSQSSAEVSPSSSDSCRAGMKRRRNSIEAEQGMAFRMFGMNMRSNVDIDMMD